MADETGPGADDIEGHLDGVRDTAIHGWAWRPGAPDDRILVELVLGDEVIATAPANRLRPDLAAAGKGDGGYAFEFPITERLPRDVPLLARVPGGDGHVLLVGGPVTLSADTPNAAPPPAELPPEPPARWSPPGPISGPSGVVGYIDQFGPERIFGWAWRTGDTVRPVTLGLYEAGREIARIEASAWRRDLYERRQGDGRCGVDAPVPDVLRDGAVHLIDIVLAETGERLTPEAFEVLIPEAASAEPPAAAIARPAASGPVQVSFVVNFYNMRREAERTLTSLTRAYQRGVEEIAYEVLCIDNGSNPPLDPAWIESFGPEFRLFRPSRILPSPCAAINEAARSANGRHVAIMIDGAHVLTPGVMREAVEAFGEDPDGVFAPRQWWLAGDQRWLSSVGYTREMEDALFARIAWPSDGYELFRIGVPMVESDSVWFDPMNESNCLIVSKALYERIGGMDEGFTEPGAGFANLDLFRRACDAAAGKIVSPVGEASFHQFHDGTTTNVSNEEKDRRVRLYHSQYRDLRGEGFGTVATDRLYLRGRIRSNAMRTSSQQPWFPAELGVTEHVRPIQATNYADPSAHANFQSAYVECGLYRGTVWAGRPVRLAPADLLNIQSILNTVRPEVIVTTSRDEGLIHFIESILPIIRLEGARIVRVLPEPGETPATRNVQSIHGPAYAPETLAAVACAVGGAEEVVVLFEPQAGDFLPVEEIKAYARFVSFRSYFVFLGTVLGQPWLGYSRYWFAAALRFFMQQDPSFASDPTMDAQIALMCAEGYLQRVRRSDAQQIQDAAPDEPVSVPA